MSALIYYIVIGGMVGIISGFDSRPEFRFHLLGYFKSLVVIAAVAFGSCTLLQRIGVERLLSKVLGLLAVSSAAVAIASLFGYAYQITPESNAIRFSGVFQNPNQAGFLGCLTLVLALSFLSFNLQRKLAYIALTLATLVIIGSFSRVALFILTVVFVCFFVGNVRARKAITKWLVMVCIIGFIAWMSIGSTFMKLEDNQLHRITSIVNVFGQEGFHDSSWNKRAVLLKLALDEVLKSPIFGNGIGRLHRLDKSPYYSPQGEPQGAHNQYLTLAGEAGIVPLLLLLFFFYSLIFRPRMVPRSVSTATVAGWSLVLAIYFLTSHTALTLRFCNFLIGLSCAMAGLERIKATRFAWRR